MAGTIVTDRIESDGTYDSKIELASPVLVSNTFAVKSTGGTGVFNIVGANTNTDRTFTLPDAAGEVVTNSATQTLTNKTIQGGTTTSATAVASTSGTSIDFTGIPDYVKRITVMFNGVSTNGSSIIQVQLGDSGGVENTGYVAGTTSAFNGLAGTSFTSGFGIRTSNAAAVLYSGHMVFTNLNANNWVCSGILYAADNQALGMQAGNKTLSDVLDRIRITTVNGTDTFDAGSINILFE